MTGPAARTPAAALNAASAALTATVSAAATPNSASAARSGWQAQLELGFARRGDRTVLAHRRHLGPLLVQRPFYPEDEVCHVYVIHPPGGIVGGDVLQLDVDVASDAHALLTTPAAGKFYRSGGERLARLTQTLHVGGVLEWLPQENIFYPGAAVQLRTRIELDPVAKFIGWEIASLGLPASGAAFDAGEIYQSLELFRDGRPLLLERLRLVPECMPARWGFAGRHAHGTLLACPATRQELETARTADCAEGLLGCTLVDDVLVCRALAPRADRLRQTMIEIWRELRPAVLGRAAMLPRIWAT